jgi:molybdopterin converting factor small subunit
VTTVRIPPPLRASTNGERQVEATGATVRDVLDDLTSRFPALRGQVFEGDTIAPFINVFLESEDVRTLDGLDTSVADNSTVMLLPAMAGGSPRVLRGSLPVQRRSGQCSSTAAESDVPAATRGGSGGRLRRPGGATGAGPEGA